MSKLYTECKKSIKINLIPGIILQSFAITLVILYYNLEPVKEFCNHIADLKTEYGYFFSAVSTALFGGFLPCLYLIYRGDIKRNLWLSHGLFFCLFWFYKGMEVDFLYRMQALMFGNETNFSTIAKKVAFDQFVYNLFYACASITICYMWKDNGFSFKETKKKLNKETFTLTLPAVIVSTWIVWLPTTAIVYSLPSALQVPLFNIVLCFFVLMLATLCESEENPN
ncbi:MAG: hypothetical protein NE328_14270 [Lentisphaeraceae bacterium]|nr:hypothetical protein [Lentisphaeraceae bacterium]